MRKKRVLVSLLIGLGIASIAMAEITPKSGMADARIKQVEYQKNNVVTIEGEAFVSTQIIFGEDEVILDVQGGDEAGWTAHIDKSLPHILNIKPTLFDSNTNLSVVTSDAHQRKRMYRFHLLMGKTVSEQNATYAVEFIYPDKEEARLQETLNYFKHQQLAIMNASKKPGDYHWDYSFNGDKSILPVHVFDDDQFTYLQLRPGQMVPSVFAVDNRAGDESVVNTRTEGDYLVIQQLAPQFTLREGLHHVASLFNDSVIEKRRAEEESA